MSIPEAIAEVAPGTSARDRYVPESSVSPLDGPMMLTWLNSVVASPLFSTRVRVRLLRMTGIQLGSCGVWPHFTFIGGHDVAMADGVFVNSGVVFDARAPIRLGPNVAVGPGVRFLTSTHPLGPAEHRAGDGVSVFGPIAIGEGSWIGAGATILAGVTVGPGCVIGAGAVVNRDCEPHGLYVGVPAQRKDDLPGHSRRSAKSAM